MGENGDMPESGRKTSGGWLKSSFSADGAGNCVEIVCCGGDVLIRSSRNPGGGILQLSGARWADFLRSVVQAPDW